MPTTKQISGIIGACLTPFDVNDRIDYKALEKEIEFLIPDCDAITVAAVEAAEYTMLSRDERKEILKVATEMIGGRVPVILGCSSPAPREVIELADYSAKVGGDFIQVLMPLRPWGGQPTIAESVAAKRQLASAAIPDWPGVFRSAGLGGKLPGHASQTTDFSAAIAGLEATAFS